MTNYDAGTRFERETRKHLEADGYWVIKAAGSKGKADLVAIKPGQVLIVQCKRTGACPPAERAEVLRIARLLPGIGVPLVASRPRVTFRELTGNGPKEWRPWVSDEVGGGSIVSAHSSRIRGISEGSRIAAETPLDAPSERSIR